MPRHPLTSLVAPLLVAALVAGGVLVARNLGLLESLELATYDAFIRLRPFDPPPDPRITIVTVTENDVHAYGWPLADGILARAIEEIARQGALAIGLDIYRDVPIPPGSETLDAVLTHEPRVVVVRKFAEGGSSGVKPPAALEGTEQVGFNDILVDPGGVVRRGILFVDDGQTVLYSFALRLALLYLQSRGVGPQADPADPSLLRLGRVTIRPLESNEGGYVRADARGYQFLLDYKGAARPFASVDLSALLDGTADPAALRDKVVLIGVTAESIKDEFYTPFSRRLQDGQHFTGVAVHADIVSQLLRMGLEGDAPMASLPDWAEGAWIALWCLAGAAVGLAVRSPWWFPVVAAAGIVTLCGVDLVAFLRDWWLPLAPPAVGWLVAAAGVIAHVSYQESVQRAVLMQLFSRHVSREIAETIWEQREQFAHGGRPRPERMVVTALFTDLTGFTTVSERHSPEVLLEWLNEYMEAMTQEVSRHGGVIRQYAGDAVVALFGIPVRRDDEAAIVRDARNAVECALAMEASLVDLNRRWRTEGRPTTGMRVGIFTGPVVVGTMGSAERSEYVTIGDTMNTASRLESYDKAVLAPDVDTRPCRILIGEPTLQRLGDAFETERVGEVSLKGKEHLVSIYRVIGRRRESEAAEEESRDERRYDGRGDRHVDGRPGPTASWARPGEVARTTGAEPSGSGRGEHPGL